MDNLFAVAAIGCEGLKIVSDPSWVKYLWDNAFFVEEDLNKTYINPAFIDDNCGCDVYGIFTTPEKAQEWLDYIIPYNKKRYGY